MYIIWVKAFHRPKLCTLCTLLNSCFNLMFFVLTVSPIIYVASIQTQTKILRDLLRTLGLSLE